MDGLFPHIFHGERSELREKYRLGQKTRPEAALGRLYRLILGGRLWSFVLAVVEAPSLGLSALYKDLLNYR